MLSKMSGKCHVRLENVWKISHASEKCPEYCNIPDRQYSGKRPEYCNISDIFWTQTFSGHLFFIGYLNLFAFAVRLSVCNCQRNYYQLFLFFSLFHYMNIRPGLRDGI